MIVLSEAACHLIGLVPAGPVEPHVYGLERVKRQDGGWCFTVRERWRVEVVRAVVHRLVPETGTPSIAAVLARRLGGVLT